MRYYKTELSQSNPHYISKHKFAELRHFCMQYEEWQKGLNEISFIAGVVSMGIDSGDISNTVSEIAEQREKYLDNIKLVEQCAKRTDEFFWKYVLIGVTTDVGYDNLRLVHDIPCCRNKYYQMYRKFFYILAQHR